MRNLNYFYQENKRTLVPLGILVFIVAALFLTLNIAQRNLETRSKAAADTAVLSFVPSTVTTGPGETFNVSVNLNTGGQSVTSADIMVNFDQNQYTLLDVSQPSHSVFKTYAPINTNSQFDKQRVVNEANSTGIIDFGILAFDLSTNELTGDFNGVVSPVTTFQFQTLSNATGTSNMSFVYTGATATDDSNVITLPNGASEPEDILSAPTSNVNITVTQAGASPSPSASPVNNPSPSPSASPVNNPSPSPSASPVNNPSPSPSESPVSNLQELTLSIKFQGVNHQAPDQQVRVTFVLGSTVASVVNPTFTASTSGVFTNPTPITGLQPGTYDIYIKGPAHLQRKFANQTVTAAPGALDFTSQLLLPGDAVPNEKVDIFDFARFVTDFGPNMPPEGTIVDFDMNGRVDIFDFSLFVTNFDRTGDQTP